jgi:hypothetical protein
MTVKYSLVFWAGMLSGLASAQVATPLRAPAFASLGGAVATQAIPSVQAATPVQGVVASTAAPPTLTLKDALERAQANSQQVLSAMSDVSAAHEDFRQSRAVPHSVPRSAPNRIIWAHKVTANSPAAAS